MGRYLIRRFAELILTVFLIATATFFLLEAVPGDPLTQRADHLPEQTRTALYQRYGLDKPVMERYLITMKKMCKGDFGESFVYAGQTVTGLLKTKLPVSARLGIQQMLLGVTLGLFYFLIYSTSTYSMNRNYFAPISPFNKEYFFESVLKEDVLKNNKRSSLFTKKNLTKMKVKK